jgi:hypothetical protein
MHSCRCCRRQIALDDLVPSRSGNHPGYLRCASSRTGVAGTLSASLLLELDILLAAVDSPQTRASPAPPSTAPTATPINERRPEPPTPWWERLENSVWVF